MKKEVIRIILAAVLVLSMTAFAGCSKMKDADTKEAETDGQSSAQSEAQGKTGNNENAENTTNTGSGETELYVFIASSLTNAMTEIQKMYQQVASNVKIIFNSDSSGTLQTQVEEGAECDIFFSAAMKQMDDLNAGGYIESDSITKLLENKVVLIKPTGGETKVTGFENIYEAKNIALAGKDVPVGAYAREIFTNLGIMEKVNAMEINEGANVTAVLAAVSEASNEVGVVYATDANSVKNSVEIIATAPESSFKTPVIYPVGLVKNPDSDEAQKNAAKNFAQFLTSKEAISVFEKYGFTAYTE